MLNSSASCSVSSSRSSSLPGGPSRPSPTGSPSAVFSGMLTCTRKGRGRQRRSPRLVATHGAPFQQHCAYGLGIRGMVSAIPLRPQAAGQRHSLPTQHSPTHRPTWGNPDRPAMQVRQMSEVRNRSTSSPDKPRRGGGPGAVGSSSTPSPPTTSATRCRTAARCCAASSNCCCVMAAAAWKRSLTPGPKEGRCCVTHLPCCCHTCADKCGRQVRPGQAALLPVATPTALHPCH